MRAEAKLQVWRHQDEAANVDHCQTVTLTLQGHGVPLFGFFFFFQKSCEVGMPVIDTPLLKKKKQRVRRVQCHLSVGQAGNGRAERGPGGSQ